MVHLNSTIGALLAQTWAELDGPKAGLPAMQTAPELQGEVDLESPTAASDASEPPAPKHLERPGVGSRHVGLGWTSGDISQCTVNGLWRALNFMVRNPDKFMDVSNVVVVERSGYITRAMTINASKKRIDEHVYINERSSELVYRPLCGRSKRETQRETVIAVKENPLRLEFFLRNAQDGCRRYWQIPESVVEQVVRELAAYAAKTEVEEKEAVGLGVHSAEICGVSHDAVWRAMVSCIREPERFFHCCDVVVEDCERFVQRTLTTPSGKTYAERIYSSEQACEIAYRKVTDGVEEDVERVVALRTHPMQLEFFQRSTSDGYRVHWDMASSVPLAVAEKYLAEARRVAGRQPTVIGYGVTSDPVQGCSYEALFMAVKACIRQPWSCLDVEKDSCQIKECEGYMERRMRLKATGDELVERIVVNEESSEVVFCKCDSQGRPGARERVLAVRLPLRLELFERAVGGGGGVRLHWQAPYTTGRAIFDKLVRAAKVTARSSSKSVIGYGVASKPMTGVTEDALWKAMLWSVHHPAKCGMWVDNVTLREVSGHLQRSMRMRSAEGCPTMTENVHVLEEEREITYRVVVNGQETGEERVFALRVEPMRCEMFSRLTVDGSRVDWQAPRGVALGIFGAVEGAAKRSAWAVPHGRYALLLAGLQWAAAGSAAGGYMAGGQAKAAAACAFVGPMGLGSPFSATGFCSSVAGAAPSPAAAALGGGASPQSGAAAAAAGGAFAGLLGRGAAAAAAAAFRGRGGAERRRCGGGAGGGGGGAAARGAAAMVLSPQARTSRFLEPLGLLLSRAWHLTRHKLLEFAESFTEWEHIRLKHAQEPCRIEGATAPVAAPAEPAVRYEERLFEVEGEQRRFGLFTPASLQSTPQTKAPALVFLHGFSRSHEKHHGMAKRLAERLGMVVLTPDMPPLLEWAMKGRVDEGQQRCIQEAVQFVKWLRNQPGVDPERVVVGGFSAGGAAAFEAAVELQSEGLPPLALVLADAVPWPRSAGAAPRMQSPLEGGILLVESEPSAYNESLAFRREVLPALPDWSRESGLRVVSVPGSKHVDVEDGGETWLDSVLGRLVWGTPCAEKTLVFHDLLEGFVGDAVHTTSGAATEARRLYQPMESLLETLAVQHVAFG